MYKARPKVEPKGPGMMFYRLPGDCHAVTSFIAMTEAAIDTIQPQLPSCFKARSPQPSSRYSFDSRAWKQQVMAPSLCNFTWLLRWVPAWVVP